MKWRSFRACSLLLIVAAGCGTDDGPELTEVAGTITLGGEPLADARVIFTPSGGGRPAYGLTNSDGEYELGYSTTGMGTPPGEYIVKITTYREPEEDIETGETTPERPENVPAIYNQPSTLRIAVPAESYDFALESGEVMQPQFDDEE